MEISPLPPPPPPRGREGGGRGEGGAIGRIYSPPCWGSWFLLTLPPHCSSPCINQNSNTVIFYGLTRGLVARGKSFATARYCYALHLLIIYNTVGAASQWWSNERMMVYFKLMMVKGSLMMAKCSSMHEVNQHSLIRPSLRSCTDYNKDIYSLHMLHNIKYQVNRY